MSKEKCCLVLGMHRSGTSALTRVLNIMGAAVSDDLLPGLPSDNTSGFWESRAVYNLHNQLFARLGVDWFNVSNEITFPTEGETITEFLSGIDSILEQEFSKNPLIVLKDPRICILAPYWINAIRSRNAIPVAVIPIRNPLEVAASLKHRNDIDTQYSLLLWLRHFVDAEHFSRDLPRSFCTFSNLLNDWKNTVTKIAVDIDIDWPNTISGIEEQVGEFLSSDAKHQNTSEEQFFGDQDIPEIVKKTYRLALELVNAGDNKHIHQQLDSIRNTVLTIDSLVVKRLISQDQKQKELKTSMFDEINQLQSLIADQTSAIEEKTGDIAKKQEEIAALNEYYLQKQAELENQLTERSDAITMLEKEIASYQNSLSWKLSLPLRQLGKLHKKLTAAPVKSLRTSTSKDNNNITNIRHSCIFDGQFYAKQLDNTACDYDDYIVHYCVEGVTKGLDPNPFFSTDFYLQNNPDVAAANENPFSHYLTNGWLEGRDPAPTFSTKHYLEANPDVAKAKVNPLVHYYLTGQHENRPLVPVQTATNAHIETKTLAHEPLADNPVLAFDPEKSSKTKLVAFYLPQFHPIPENDEWWGKGFTEWTNVCSATPSFTNHKQPLLPGELGYYDLRLSEIREQQAQLAKEHGIYGFCYYYYWFNGRRLLEKPLDDLLQSGKPDFPFCICWANEDWTRSWDGIDTNILMAQRHSVASDQEFIHDVIPILKDSRYIRLDGKPLLMVYRAELMDQPKKVTDLWREACRKAGIGEIYLTSVIFREFDPVAFGFDSAVEFPPHFFPAPEGKHKVENLATDFDGLILDYEAGVNHAITHPIKKPFPVIRGVMPAWDNTARRGRSATVFHGSTPLLYGQWLRSAINQPCNNNDTNETIVFINAWNEWAEGAVLEPSQQHGRAYLEATRWALTDNLPSGGLSHTTALQNPESPKRPAKTKSIEKRLTEFVLRSPTLTSIAFKNRKVAGSILNGIRKISGNTQEHKQSSAKTAPTLSPSNRHIVLVGHDAHPHGAQTLLLYIAKTLHEELGFTIDMVLLGEGRLIDDYCRYAKVHQLSPGDNGNDLISRLRNKGARHAITNTTVSGIFAAQLKQQHFHVVSLIHELPGVIEQYKLRQHVQKIAEYADHIVFPAEKVREGFTEFCDLPTDKTRILPQGLFRPNALDDNESRQTARRDLREKFSLPDNAFIVLGVGYIDHRKGVDLFTSAAIQACKKASDLYFIWVGHHDPQMYNTLIAKLKKAGIADRVIFPGIDFETDLYYAGADVFALSSREDPFPCVVLEALDAYLPVVAFEDAGGFCTLLQELGHPLVSRFDTHAYASAILRLYHDPALGKQLGEAGHHRVMQDYNFRRYCMELVTIDPNLLKKVSVILPNYNYSRFLRQRVESINTQSYPIWEIIILDDASTDDSVALLNQLLPELKPATQLVINTHNTGNVFRQWDKGVSLVSGDYLWIAEADDLAEADFLQTLMPAFQDEEVVISYCESAQMAEDAHILSKHYQDYLADISTSKWQQDYIAEGTDEICSVLAIKNSLPNVSAVVFRTSTLKTVLDSHIEEICQLKIAGDWLTYIHVLSHGKIAFSATPMNNHRRHDDSITLNSFGQQQLDEIISMQQFVKNNFDITDDITTKADAYIQQLYQQFGLVNQQTSDLKNHSNPTDMANQS